MSADEPLIRYEALEPAPVHEWSVYVDGDFVGRVRSSLTGESVAYTKDGAHLCYGATRAEAVSALIESLETP